MKSSKEFFIRSLERRVFMRGMTEKDLRKLLYQYLTEEQLIQALVELDDEE